MRFLKAALFFCFFLISKSLFAQVTDSTGNADTLHRTRFIVNDTASIDTASIIVADSIRLHRSQALQDSLANVSHTSAHTGYWINGKVEDMNTGEGVPFATVFFPHTQVGTPAGLDGNFIIKMDKLPGDTLHIEAMGYKGVNKVLKKSQYDYNYIIELERANTGLEEFVVHAGEDPAVVLMRHIIEHKPDNNPDKLENYNYEAYNRLEADLQRLTKSQFQKIPMLKSYSFIFNNLDTEADSKPYLPLYLTETISDYYFQRHPKKQREFINGSMVKGVNNENVDK